MNSQSTLAQEIIDYWDAHPGFHEQESWVGGKVPYAEDDVCGTTMCAAGTAVFLAHGPSAVKQTLSGISDMSFAEQARDLLGLNYAESDALFYSNNEQARNMMQALAIGDRDRFRAYAALASDYPLAELMEDV